MVFWFLGAGVIGIGGYPVWIYTSGNTLSANFGAKPYTDLAIRYAKAFGKFAIKGSFQRLSGTDFIAGNYSDRSTSARSPFWASDASRGGVATGTGYVPNNDSNTNLQYDGVNIYGDEIAGNNGSFTYPASFATAALAGKAVTRTGYTELDVLGNNGKVFNNRANISAHYRITPKIEASIGWYYGEGNLIRTAGFREYIPDYQKHQFKADGSTWPISRCGMIRY